MKKLTAALLALVMVLSLCACGGSKPAAPAPTEEPTPEVMTYAEYCAAELQTPVVIEASVQAKQAWWDNKATVYTQDEDGAYFLYEMACSEEDYAKLVPGTVIRVSGYKSEWSGEVEIIDSTFEIIGNDGIIADALDVTELCGTDELIAHQNEVVCFKNMTVKSVSYKNDQPGDDIYVTATAPNGAEVNFCVEFYLTNTETDVYAAVGELQEGELVDIEGFLYWYEGANPHITSVIGTMNYEEYCAAGLQSPVVIAAAVQAKQAWWADKATVYTQDEDGAYFLYEMACSEEDYAKLVPGTVIRVSGYKSEWSGEVEIIDATFSIVGNDGIIAEALDVTELCGTDELIAHQNEVVCFKGMTVNSVSYKNDQPGDDIYVTATAPNGTEVNFCVEFYLTNTETEVYAAVGELQEGDVIDIEGFLYWYEGANPHITSVTKA